MFQRSSLRGSKERGSRRKISRDMISGPTGQVQHTGHIGPDGCFFGDVTFMSSGGGGTNGQLSTTTTTTASASSAGGRLPSTGSENGQWSLSRADSDVSDSAPLLSSGGGSRAPAQQRPANQPRMGHAIGYLRYDLLQLFHQLDFGHYRFSVRIFYLRYCHLHMEVKRGSWTAFKCSFGQRQSSSLGSKRFR
jgi:hypothetical protein